MENAKTRLPIHNREAMQYNYAVLSQLGGTRISAAMGTTDQAALNTNGARIVAEDTVTNLLAQLAADGTLTIAAQPDVARNVVIAAHNDSGGALNLYEGTTTFRVTGVFRGETQVEDISVTSSAANKAIANAKYRAWSGVKPFDSITSITLVTPIAAVPAAGLKLAVGIGVLMGLPVKPYGNVKEDIVHLIIDGTLTDIGTLYSAANNTIDINTIADSKGWQVIYWVNLSEIRERLLGV